MKEIKLKTIQYKYNILLSTRIENRMELFIITEQKNDDGVLTPSQHAEGLRTKYLESIEKHNKKLEDQKTKFSRGVSGGPDLDSLADSGFDLFVPPASPHKESQQEKGWVNYRGSWYIKPRTTVKIPLGIKLVRKPQDARGRGVGRLTLPYYVYPRSSIYKTPLRLANCTGIIDAGYRGELMAVFDNISDEGYELKPHTRLLQACSPDLMPFCVRTVDEDFNMTTRGEGGLGSTGR